MMRVADTLALLLHAYGVRHAFGIAGGEIVTLIDALQKAGIAFHLTRHETPAALMAAGVHALTGTPGLLVATVGPGLANAVNGIADAAQERVPLIILSGIVDRPTRARYTHQVIDQAALLRPLVKASFEIEPESAASTLTRALEIALAPPMGPVHLDLSPANAANLDPKPCFLRPPLRIAPKLASHDPALLAFAARLNAAKRPLIVVGLEAARAVSAPMLTDFAERLGAAVITTYKAKGIIPEDHPLALGGAGLSPAADGILLDLVAGADIIVLLGYDPIEMRLNWLDFAEGERLAEISAATPDHGMHHAALRLLADPAHALEVLLPSLSPRNDRWEDGAVERVRERLKARFNAPPLFGPHAIIETVNAFVDEETVVTVDTGAHRILLAQKWTARRPLRLLQSAGFCTMGTALPLAMGAKLAAPERNVIAMLGDGGLEMVVGELATLRDLRLPITLVVFQDLSLALIALKQASAGLAPAGVALGPTDFAMLARSFGGHGVTVTHEKALLDELNAAKMREHFTLIACRFDADAYTNAF